MPEWDQCFLVLQPSAAKVFAVAWLKKVEELLKERGSEIPDAELLREAFKVTYEKSSSLPVKDQRYRLVTLYCVLDLFGVYHPYGSMVDRTVKARGWSDSTWDIYLRLLRRHGLEFNFGR